MMRKIPGYFAMLIGILIIIQLMLDFPTGSEGGVAFAAGIIEIVGLCVAGAVIITVGVLSVRDDNPELALAALSAYISTGILYYLIGEILTSITRLATFIISLIIAFIMSYVAYIFIKNSGLEIFKLGGSDQT